MKNIIERFKKWFYLDSQISDYIIGHINRNINTYTYRKIIEKTKGHLWLSELKVQHGPFKGMKYSSFEAIGSALYPKLLGSYERELTDIINEIKDNEYSQILDIGCAEGYYAVGFAYLAKLNNFKTKVYAYDIDARARILCKKMVKLNKVADIVTINNKCTSNILANFKFIGRSLVISDCEGYERELFTKTSARNLVNCDVLIEVHDFDITKNYKVSNFDYLIKIFKDTHKYKIIYSIEDYEKVYKYKYEELKVLNNQEKFYILSERPKSMKWLFFTPINQ